MLCVLLLGISSTIHYFPGLTTTTATDNDNGTNASNDSNDEESYNEFVIGNSNFTQKFLYVSLFFINFNLNALLALSPHFKRLWDELNANSVNALETKYSNVLILQQVVQSNPGKSVIMSAYSVLIPLAELALYASGASLNELLRTFNFKDKDQVLFSNYIITGILNKYTTYYLDRMRMIQKQYMIIFIYNHRLH